MPCCPVFPVTSEQKNMEKHHIDSCIFLELSCFSPEISLWVKLLWLKEIIPALKAFLTFERFLNEKEGLEPTPRINPIPISGDQANSKSLHHTSALCIFPLVWNAIAEPTMSLYKKYSVTSILLWNERVIKLNIYQCLLAIKRWIGVYCQ